MIIMPAGDTAVKVPSTVWPTFPSFLTLTWIVEPSSALQSCESFKFEDQGKRKRIDGDGMLVEVNRPTVAAGI